MAEQITRDVVKEAQSMGGSPPIDDNATSTQNSAGNGEAPPAHPTTTAKPSENTSADATSTEKANAAAMPASDKAGSDAAAKPPADSSDQQKTTPATSSMKDPPANSDSGEHSAAEDGSSQHLVGEVSGGSDTDISRPGSVDQSKDRAAGHLRTNSTKKATAFKSVSVTKNFLAKSAVSTPSAQPGSKVTPAGQANTSALQTAKPRLVAKSGSGFGGVSRSSLSKTNGVGSGPDASKVWNKNQPVPPPPPKQFTDEELKQQYGIHLATRLQSDESSKEAKWADIDDDEDDWAPDTVQWMDGTKSSVATAAVENQPPPEEPKPAVKKETPEAAKPPPAPVTISQKPSSTSGTKTILKPGAHSQTTGKAGLVLKGQPEKPTLVAKPSTGAVKSPWAPLPPVEKASPVQINPPQQPPPPQRFQSQPHAFDSGPPSHPAGREIAADDFSRSWRDDRGNRELFNSHSGRYEPVNDMRRGSMRDNGLRQQPSVLQRPTQDGPAEPSAAFQTSRTSADVPAWSRRRTSSNVSGGSGRMLADRRVSEVHPVPLNIQRRESHSMNGPDVGGSGAVRPVFAQKGHGGDAHSAVMDQQAAWTQRPSPSLSNVQPASPYGSVGSVGHPEGGTPTLPVPIEDAVEVQNRLMREKLERARLAKQKEREREEREEAERKERLRKKLEAMGLADKSKPKTSEQAPVRANEKSPRKDKAVPVPVQSPPKPPVPTSEGEVAQYGMMKVHQPHPVKKPQPTEGVSPKLSKAAHDSPHSNTSPVKTQAEVQPQSVPTVPTSTAPSSSSQPLPPTKPADRNNKIPVPSPHSQLQQSEADTRPSVQTLKPAQPTPSAWNTTPLPQQPRPWASNVWGPPQAKDRALGNGTFDSGYNRSQPNSSPQQLPPSQSGQPPSLGLTQQLKTSPAQAQSVQPPYTQNAMYTQTQTETKPLGGIAAPIARPRNKAWGNFESVIRADDQAMVERHQRELKRMGGETFRPEIRETYTNMKGQAEKTVHTKVAGNVILVGGMKPEGPQAVPAELKPKEDVSKPAFASSAAGEGPAAPSGQMPHVSGTGTGARSSRFFPRAADTTQHHPAPVVRPSSPPPPPPVAESHPAFVEELPTRPVVKLPRPSPVVRLPPAAVEQASHADRPVSMPEGPASTNSKVRLGLGARPLALNPEWQARFNSLLHVQPKSDAVPTSSARTAPAVHPVGHARPAAAAVAASSKAPLDVRQNQASATVSLPSHAVKKSGNEPATEYTTRTLPEEQLLEDREFGSLPVVKVPKVSHGAANERAAPFPSNRTGNRNQRIDVTSKPAFHVNDFDRNSETIDVVVRTSNMASPVTKSMPNKKRQSRGGQNKGPKRNYNTNSGAPNSTQSQRPRKPSNFHRQDSNNSNQSLRSAGGNPWTNRSNQSHNTTSPWGRRADPVH